MAYVANRRRGRYGIGFGDHLSGRGALRRAHVGRSRRFHAPHSAERSETSPAGSPHRTGTYSSCRLTKKRPDLLAVPCLIAKLDEMRLAAGCLGFAVVNSCFVVPLAPKKTGTASW